MIETIIQVNKGRYPFDQVPEKGHLIKVEDVQNFSRLNSLTQKKNEMIQKNKLIKSSYIVDLIKIQQNQLSLHYIYEHVPYSFEKYIHKYYQIPPQNIQNARYRLFLKKITYEIAMLISYLIDMRIEIDISIDNMGLTHDEKLKVFMNHRCKMGRKTQISLVAYYNSRKQKILNFLEQQFNKITDKDNNLGSGITNNSFLSSGPDQESFSYNNYETARISLQARGFDHFGCFQTPQPSSQAGQSFADYQSSFFISPNQTTSSILEASIKIKSPQKKYSRQTAHNIGRDSKYINNLRKEAMSSNKDKKGHKNTFQFGNNFEQQSPKKRFDEDKSDTKSFTHSKSVRIQLQQNSNGNTKKNRKNSYKVKITTFHEYQMEDCDPRDLFGNIPKNEEDIFDYFDKNTKNTQQHQKTEEDQKHWNRNTEPQTPQDLQAPVFIRKQSMPQTAQQNNADMRTLEEKVRMAKQKAQQMVSRYKKIKKSVSMMEEPKFSFE